MSIRRLFFTLAIIGIFILSFDFANDPDMWWHLKVGEYIVENGIPDTDPGYSFTAGDNEWFMHEWLSEVVMHFMYEIGGLIGLSIFFTVLNSVIFLLLYFCSPGRPYAGAFVVLWGAIASSFFMAVRPQMFNLLLASWFVFVLENYRTGRLNKKWLWSFVPLMTLWANLHSGFLTGIVILGVYGLGGILQILTSSELVENRDFDRAQIRYMIYLGFAMVAASLLNPKFYGVWLYPFETTLLSEAMQAFIVEWQSPDFHNSLYWFFGTYLFMGMAVLILTKEKVTWTEILLVFGSSMASLQAGRNITIFVIVSIPIFSRHLVGMTKDTALYGILSGTLPDAKIPKTMERLNVVLLGIILLMALGWVANELSKHDKAIAEDFPVDGLAFLEEHKLASQQGFNHYDWGGYLIWHNVPVYIDGRADLYGDQFFIDYAKIMNGVDAEWKSSLDKYQVDYVFIKPRGAFMTLIKLSPDWALIYEDDMAVIFVPADSELATLSGD